MFAWKAFPTNTVARSNSRAFILSGEPMVQFELFATRHSESSPSSLRQERNTYLSFDIPRFCYCFCSHASHQTPPRTKTHLSEISQHVLHYCFRTRKGQGDRPGPGPGCQGSRHGKGHQGSRRQVQVHHRLWLPCLQHRQLVDRVH